MKAFWQTILIIIVGSLIILLTASITGKVSKPQTIEVEKRVIITAPKCLNNYDDYNDLTKKGQSLQLLNDVSSYAAGGNFLPNGLFELKVNRAGNISCGYLYVKASKGNKILDNTYDSIYINPQDFGGHLLRSRSITLPNQSDQATEVLFSLEAIPYLPNIPYNPNAQDFRISNWINVLSASDSILFRIGLSTNNPGGKIEEIKIAYRCWNPNTGEETNDCQLSK